MGLAACSGAFAASNYFLQITNIPGEFLDKGHPGWIEVSSFSWGLNCTPAGGAGRGKASFNDLAWSQFVDSSTSRYCLALATGQRLAKVELDATKQTGKEAPDVFFKMEFENTLATKLLIGGLAVLAAPALRRRRG